MLDESGYTAMLQADRTRRESAGRLENLAELARAMEEYETLAAFLEHVTLVMDNDENRQGEKVTIMTIHAAKGLEFDAVYLARLGGRHLPVAARARRGRPRQPRGGTPPRLRRHHPRAKEGDRHARRQPPHLRPVDQLAPQPLRRRAARGAYRAGNDDVRRREPVASAMERARRPLRPPRPRAEHARRPAVPAGSAQAARPLQPRPPARHRSQGFGRLLGNQGRTDLDLGQRVFHGKFGYGRSSRRSKATSSRSSSSMRG